MRPESEPHGSHNISRVNNIHLSQPNAYMYMYTHVVHERAGKFEKLALDYELNIRKTVRESGFLR